MADDSEARCPATAGAECPHVAAVDEWWQARYGDVVAQLRRAEQAAKRNARNADRLAARLGQVEAQLDAALSDADAQRS